MLLQNFGSQGLIPEFSKEKKGGGGVVCNLTIFSREFYVKKSKVCQRIVGCAPGAPPPPLIPPCGLRPLHYSVFVFFVFFYQKSEILPKIRMKCVAGPFPMQSRENARWNKRLTQCQERSRSKNDLYSPYDPQRTPRQSETGSHIIMARHICFLGGDIGYINDPALKRGALDP